MSNIEHLIENAIGEIEEGKNFDDFKNRWYNIEMIKYVKSPIEEIWEIAMYVYYTYKPCIESDIKADIELKYGYPIPE